MILASKWSPPSLPSAESPAKQIHQIQVKSTVRLPSSSSSSFSKSLPDSYLIDLRELPLGPQQTIQSYLNEHGQDEKPPFALARQNHRDIAPPAEFRDKNGNHVRVWRVQISKSGPLWVTLAEGGLFEGPQIVGRPTKGSELNLPSGIVPLCKLFTWGSAWSKRPTVFKTTARQYLDKRQCQKRPSLEDNTGPAQYDKGSSASKKTSFSTKNVARSQIIDHKSKVLLSRFRDLPPRESREIANTQLARHVASSRVNVDDDEDDEEEDEEEDNGDGEDEDTEEEAGFNQGGERLGVRDVKRRR